MIEQFKKDVLEGLSKANKTLPSKYFYDNIGDALFQKIMAMPEYYLTRSEFEIFSNQTNDIVTAFGCDKTQIFEIIELGAGDGTKTIKLLEHLVENDYQFSYLPIDISQNALNGLEAKIKSNFKTINVLPQQGTYFEVLEKLQKSEVPKIILFLGSNLGNLSDKKAKEFLLKLAHNLNKGDKILLGLDLIKSKEIVLPAYNDKAGITKEFNLNLLSRINTELGGNFEIESFSHNPEYTQSEGIARSYITSLKKQEVYIKALDTTFTFEKEEKIHTEVSRKYNLDILNNILSDTNLEIHKQFYDSKKYFCDFILKKV